MRRKARAPSRTRKSPPRDSRRFRLIESSPVVYLGPGALGAMAEGRGILLGAQRPGWVDALCFDPAPRGKWKDLVDQRFRSRLGLEAVGIVLSPPELRRLAPTLVRELVPGDVVLTVPVRRGQSRAYVNRGDRLAPARLKITRAG